MDNDNVHWVSDDICRPEPQLTKRVKEIREENDAREGLKNVATLEEYVQSYKCPLHCRIGGGESAKVAHSTKMMAGVFEQYLAPRYHSVLQNPEGRAIISDDDRGVFLGDDNAVDGDGGHAIQQMNGHLANEIALNDYSPQENHIASLGAPGLFSTMSSINSEHPLPPSLNQHYAPRAYVAPQADLGLAEQWTDFAPLLQVPFFFNEESNTGIFNSDQGDGSQPLEPFEPAPATDAMHFNFDVAPATEEHVHDAFQPPQIIAIDAEPQPQVEPPPMWRLQDLVK